MAEKKPSGLALLRVPFPENQISKLPKATKKQNDDLKADFKRGIRCTLCGGWHLPEVIHLDYVGHAALTDRLLDADENWTWEPLSFDQDGLPRLDRNGGLWIKLTVCGQTRFGYGNAEGKSGGDAIKEIIGDALRNAAMRFGAALDLWHKGDLHLESNELPEKPKDESNPDIKPKDSGPVIPSQVILPKWGGTNKGKKLGEIDLETLIKLRDHLKKQMTSTPKPKHIGEIATIYAHVKAVIAEKTPPPPDDIPENNLGKQGHPEVESQLFPPDDAEDIDNYMIPKGVFDSIDELAGIPLKKISDIELRAVQKMLTDEMAKGPKSKISAAVGFEIRNKITTFLQTMGG